MKKCDLNFRHAGARLYVRREQRRVRAQRPPAPNRTSYDATGASIPAIRLYGTPASTQGSSSSFPTENLNLQVSKYSLRRVLQYYIVLLAISFSLIRRFREILVGSHGQLSPLTLSHLPHNTCSSLMLILKISWCLMKALIDHIIILQYTSSRKKWYSHYS